VLEAVKRGKLFADFTDTLALYKNMSKANAAVVVKLIADELLGTVIQELQEGKLKISVTIA